MNTILLNKLYIYILNENILYYDILYTIYNTNIFWIFQMIYTVILNEN